MLLDVTSHFNEFGMTHKTSYSSKINETFLLSPKKSICLTVLCSFISNSFYNFFIYILHDFFFFFFLSDKASKDIFLGSKKNQDLNSTKPSLSRREFEKDKDCHLWCQKRGLTSNSSIREGHHTERNFCLCLVLMRCLKF